MSSSSDQPLLSVCIPAYNEERNIGRTIDVLSQTLTTAGIGHEFVIATDNSRDRTEEVIRSKMGLGIPIRLVNRVPPGGFGRALRCCLENLRGDVVVIVMADMSDDPNDIVRYYHKILEGYDAVYGSRFLPGSTVKDYPFTKLFANRLGNKILQLLFWTVHNDLTNSFLTPGHARHSTLAVELQAAYRCASSQRCAKKRPASASRSARLPRVGTTTYRATSPTHRKLRPASTGLRSGLQSR